MKLYAPNTRAPSLKKLLKFKSDIKHHILIVGNFGTLFSTVDRSARQKIISEIRKLRDVMTQLNLTNIYRIVNTNTKEYTFLSTPHEAFFKTDHILNHKANLNRYKKNGINPCILLDHQRLKFEFNNSTHYKNSTTS